MYFQPSGSPSSHCCWPCRHRKNTTGKGKGGEGEGPAHQTGRRQWRNKEKHQLVWQREEMRESSLCCSALGGERCWSAFGFLINSKEEGSFLSCPELTRHSIASLGTESAKITLFLWGNEFYGPHNCLRNQLLEHISSSSWRASAVRHCKVSCCEKSYEFRWWGSRLPHASCVMFLVKSHHFLLWDLACRMSAWTRWIPMLFWDLSLWDCESLIM